MADAYLRGFCGSYLRDNLTHITMDISGWNGEAGIKHFSSLEMKWSLSVNVAIVAIYSIELSRSWNWGAVERKGLMRINWKLYKRGSLTCCDIRTADNGAKAFIYI